MKEELKTVEIIDGTVNYDELTLSKDSSTPLTIKIRRTENNMRKRPNSYKRHDPLYHLNEVRNDDEYFFKNIEIEWLSINYRKYRAALKQKSNKRMVLELFSEDYQYFFQP